MSSNMKARAKLLMAKQKAGHKLNTLEILDLMNYALELLKYFGELTDASIKRKRALYEI